MKKRVEMIGEKFGKLTVIEMVGERVSGRHPNWLCKCDCGNESIKSAVALRGGNNPSCGCAVTQLQREKNNLSQQRFGKLIALRPLNESNKKRHILWVCKCDCGKESIVASSELKSGHTKSCGCLWLETVKSKCTTHGHTASKNMSSTYVSWASMLTRCRNPNIFNFHHYGGRGITVADRWLKFENFLLEYG